MEYNNKNENQELYDKYLFNRRKGKHMSIIPNKEKKNILDSFKSNNNKLSIPLITKNDKSHISYNKNNIKGLHIPENDLINLKREEAPRLFSKNYMNENKKRLNRNYYFEESNLSSKLRNSFFSNFSNKNRNLDNYHLKLEYNNNYNHLTVPNEKENNTNLNLNKNSKQNISLFENSKKNGINVESSAIKKR